MSPPPQIFLSYARKDGKDAATRLRIELIRAGFEVWQDIEDMQGGKPWKEQLRAALRAADVVLVLLTPEAAASPYVEKEWDSALTLEKRVIPLLIQKCEVPEELSSLQYHNLSTEQVYSLGFATLMRDLYQLPSSSQSELPAKAEPSAGPKGDRSVSIGGSANKSTIVTGDRNTIGPDDTP